MFNLYTSILRSRGEIKAEVVAFAPERLALDITKNDKVVFETDTVKSLDSNRNAIEKEAILAWIPSDRRDTTIQVRQEVNCARADRTKCFTCYWYK